MNKSDVQEFYRIVRFALSKTSEDFDSMTDENKNIELSMWLQSFQKYDISEIRNAFRAWWDGSDQKYSLTAGDVLKYIKGDDKAQDAAVASAITQIANGSSCRDYFVKNPKLRRFLHDNKSAINNLRTLDSTEQKWQINALVNRYKAFKHNAIDWSPEYVLSSNNPQNVPPMAIDCTVDEMREQLTKEKQAGLLKTMGELIGIGEHRDDVRRKGDPDKMEGINKLKELREMIGFVKPKPMSEKELLEELRK